MNIEDIEKEELYLPEMVINRGTKGIYKVLSIIVQPSDTDGDKENIELHPDTFVKYYEEYVDPKDIRIKALERELMELKAKILTPTGRKRRKRLEPGEVKEIKELLKKKVEVKDIANEYDSSTSAIYRVAKEMKTDPDYTMDTHL